ncbi:MAG: hypothetical protein U0P81_07425 [Holophagaceae bacterium]
MSPKPSPLPMKAEALALLTLVAIFLLAPWPNLQAVLHLLVVVGLAAQARSPLATALLACAAGWIVEGTLRAVPRMGGTPLADMAVALVARYLLARAPGGRLAGFWSRYAVLAAAHGPLAHACAWLANGPHAWGWGWLVSLLTVPLWGTVAWRLQRRPFDR